MHVLRLWSMLSGYVIIRVKGPALERLVNLAASRGVRLYDIRRVSPDVMYAQTSIGGFRALRPLARRLNCAVSIRRKGGVPFLLASLGRRKALTAGVFLFLALLYALSSLVWFIQLTGAAPARRAEMLAYLESQGLRVGAPISRLDREGLAKNLLRRYPSLTWASVEVRGTLVRVKVVEKTLVPPEELAPRHLVARRDGLVTACLPLRGEPLVKPGDTVVRGQVLISGVVPLGPEESPTGSGVAVRERGFGYLRAEGTVRARVWYEAVSVAPLSGVMEVPTGRRRAAKGLKVGSWRLWLGPRSAPFPRFRQAVARRPLPGGVTRILGFPVELLDVTFVELRQVHYHRGVALAEQVALQEAEGRLRRQVGPAKPQQVSREVERTSTAVRVRLLWEVEEEIQTSCPIRAGEPPPAGLPDPSKAAQRSEKRD
ncbi:MAG: sporulation protein YqfD [Bacillota bacterium]|nr:sporulation protein YqfD [Bacillota bacterium]